MAKKVVGTLKLHIMEFCKAFNAKTQEMENGAPCPTVITYYADKSFSMEIKTPPASYYIKKAAKLKSGSNEPGKKVAGSITGKQVREIAEAKMNRGLCSLYGHRGEVMAKLGKRTTAARAAFAGKDNVTVTEGVSLVKDNAKAKFDETIEISMVLGVDPRHADQMVRGTVNLPNGTGKTVRIAVFARGDKAEEAKAAGADIVGAEDLMETIQGGTIDFDVCIATPDMMGVVGRLGKVLGPRNLMPNPRTGTVTPDVTEAINAKKGGEIQFKAEKAGVVHAGIGKASFGAKQIEENVLAFVDAVQKARPTGAKGTYMKKISLTSTMGPGVSLAIDSATGN